MRKAIGIGALCIVGLFGLTWAAEGNNFFLYKFFAPKEEQVRREVFEQSKAYNQGMIQELQNMQFAYLQASKEQRPGLAAIILHRSADYDVNQLPPDLRAFINQLRQERMGK